MPHKLLPTIEFTRHARWLRRSTGSEHALAVCDAGGAPCWIAPGHEGLADWQPQLLVLGSRGRGALQQALLGSTARYYLRRPPCDLLVSA